MTSYASIDRIEGKWAICEVELLPFVESKTEDFAIKDTAMIDVLLNKFSDGAEEGDIFVVEHDGENVTLICYKDEKEKFRRLELLKKIIG